MRKRVNLYVNEKGQIDYKKEYKHNLLMNENIY